MRAKILKRCNILINKALATDAESLALIKKWQGHKLGLEVSDWKIKIAVEFLDSGLNCEFITDELVADVVMSAPLKAYLAMLRHGGSSASMFKQKMHIRGDASFAADCQKLLREMEVDWEALMAAYIGDVPAFRIADVCRDVGERLGFAKRSVREQLSSYLQEEIKITPTAEEVDAFTQGVAECRDHCARLQARWQILQEESE